MGSPRQAFEVGPDGYVWLPDRRHGLTGSFLYAGVRVRDFCDPARPADRLVELTGVDATGMEPVEQADSVVVRLDLNGVLTLTNALLDVVDRIKNGEVTR